MTARGSGKRVRRIEAPIFVVGCCNSGTTILTESLREHPDVTGPSVEGQDLSDLPLLLRHFLGRRTFRMFAHPRFHEAYRLTERHIEPLLGERIDGVYAEHCIQGRRFVEKSPANALRTRFLQALYPDATFVVIIRDGMAVSEGICRKRWIDPERPHMVGQATSLPDAALQWFHANRLLLSDVAHLRRAILVRYEALVRDPATVLDRICRVCGLDSRLLPIPSFDLDHNARQWARLSEQKKALIAAVLEGEAYRVAGGAGILGFLEERP